MLVILLVVGEVFFSLLYLWFARFYIFVFFAFLYYIFFYSDKSELTGNRAWAGLRSLKFWNHFTAVSYQFVNQERLKNIGDEKMYFVLMNNKTNMSLISGFGFHGSFFQDLDIRYVMPAILFRVPLLREVLLWSGGVTEKAILSMLKMGRCVASCPFGMNMEDSSRVEYKLDESIYAYALKNKVFLVPVVVEDEEKRYTIWNISWIQQWTDSVFGYPFPFFFYPNIFGSRPPKKITVQVGHPLDPTLQENVEEFQRVFMGQVNSLRGELV